MSRLIVRCLALALVLVLLHLSLAAADGEALFHAQCAACHQKDARGVPGVYPPIADRIGRFVKIPEGRAYLARMLIHGMFGPIRVEDRPYDGFMPPVPRFSDAEIADVLNYALTRLSPEQLPPDFVPLTADEVAGYREPRATPSQMRKERDALLQKLDPRASVERLIPRITGVAQDFSRQCQGCHGADGMGARDAIPRLRHFAGYFTHLPEGREYLMRVPGVVFAPIDDARLAAVLNWTLSTFSADEIAPDFEPFTVEEVARARKHPIATAQTTRKRLLAQLREKGLLSGEDDGLISAAAAGPR